MHALVSFAEPSSQASLHSSPAILHPPPTMADLRPNQTITVQWAARLGQVPSDFYWKGSDLYRGRPDYIPKGKPCEVNFSHAVNVVQNYARQWPEDRVSWWTKPENFVPYRNVMD